MNSVNKKILIIDDHRLFADGLSLMLSQTDTSLSIDTEYNARFLLNDFDALNAYDLIMMDLDMPSLSGFDFLDAINHRNANFKVLILSGSEKISDVEKALRLGANGFAQKNLPSSELLAAIKHVLAGELYLSRTLSETVDWNLCRAINSKNSKAALDVGGLRPRQLEVLKLIRDGHTNSQIGNILGISESGVKSHISILFKALQARNRTAAVKAGIDLGLI